jgi:Ion transport protein
MGDTPAPKDKKEKKVTKVIVKELTPLQKLVSSAEFDGFIILVILVSCIFMAADNPTPLGPGGSEHIPAPYIVYGNYAFTIIFFFELVLNIAAFGVLPYFMDPWHYLDAIVVASSMFELALAALTLLQGLIHFQLNINVKVLRILRVFRFFRVLRPLKALRHFKAILVFIESLTLSADILIITTGIFVVAIVGIAFLCNEFIGTLLVNRCLPALVFNHSTGITDVHFNSSARDDPNFKAYGWQFYYSRYNLDYCKSL